MPTMQEIQFWYTFAHLKCLNDANLIRKWKRFKYFKLFFLFLILNSLYTSTSPITFYSLYWNILNFHYQIHLPSALWNTKKMYNYKMTRWTWSVKNNVTDVTRYADQGFSTFFLINLIQLLMRIIHFSVMFSF